MVVAVPGIDGFGDDVERKPDFNYGRRADRIRFARRESRLTEIRHRARMRKIERKSSALNSFAEVTLLKKNANALLTVSGKIEDTTRSPITQTTYPSRGREGMTLLGARQTTHAETTRPEMIEKALPSIYHLDGDPLTAQTFE